MAIWAKVLKEDPIGRFHAGEVGVLLECDYPKYQYKLELPPIKLGEEDRSMVPFFKNLDVVIRQFYFYEGELEIINDVSSN